MSYRIEGLPREVDAPLAERTAHLRSLLAETSTCLAVFNLPEDVVPRVSGEEQCRKPRCRIVDCHDVREGDFSKIWQWTTYFEDPFDLFVVPQSESFQSALQGLFAYFKRTSWFPSEQKIMNTRDQFIGEHHRPLLLMSKIHDGQVLLLTASRDFLPMVRSIMSLFAVETTVDSIPGDQG
jgi:hypothetical protein